MLILTYTTTPLDGSLANIAGTTKPDVVLAWFWPKEVREYFNFCLLCP